MSGPVLSRPEQLPLHELTWRRFQVFCQDLISRLEDVTDCHQYGVEGNRQDGIDLFAIMKSGEHWAFQNKRWKQFGPQDLEDAVKATAYQADKYIVLLSREATSNVRKKLADFPKWHIWDRCDLSTKVRQLPLDTARRLVDDHFGSWWRREFLGVDAVAAFLGSNDFFREWLDDGRLLHHCFELIGRAEQLAALVDFTRPDRRRCAILPGRGGIGKSRLLRAFAERVEEDGAEPLLRFLVEGVPLTPASLDELPNRPCVVVVDDAHRCADLALLLAYVRRRTHLKVVLATRPHGTDRIRSELARLGFDPNEVAELPSLGPLTRLEMRDLARAALGSPWREQEDIVDRLAGVTGDCPLATVIGGRLLTTSAIAPELLAQDQLFRREVFDRFRDERLGHLGTEFSADLARQVLEVLAAVNPIPAEHNQEVLLRVATHLGANAVEVRRVVGELEHLGLLVRRGSKLRLTPDVFADHVLARACLTPQDQSTGFAEQMFQSFQELCPEIVLRNLAELDWRVRSTTGRESRLLDELWAFIERMFHTATCARRMQILEIISHVAPYQPRRVVAVAQEAMRPPTLEGKSGLVPLPDESGYTQAGVLGRLPELLMRCAYTRDTLPECLSLLWELARNDDRSAETCSEHPLRIVQNIAKFEYYGLWWVANEVARHLALWHRSPEGARKQIPFLAIIDQLLAKTGGAVFSEGVVVRHLSFHVPYAAVREARRTALAIIKDYLECGDVILQLRALGSLEEALNGPMPSGELPTPREVLASWESDQLDILAMLGDFLNCRREPVVQLRTLEAVRYQARHGSQPAVRERAQEVVRMIEDSFEVRLTRLLLVRLSRSDRFDDHEPNADRSNMDALLDRHRRHHEPVVQELWQQHRSAEAVFAHLCGLVQSLQQVEREVDARHVVWYLLQARPECAATLVKLLLAEPECPLEHCLQTCLCRTGQYDAVQATALAREAVESRHIPAVRAVADHYCWNWPTQQPLTDADVDLIRQLMAHPDQGVRCAALGALHHVARQDHGLAIQLALSVEVGRSKTLAEELARLTEPSQPGSLAPFGEGDLRTLLGKLQAADQLDHWVCALLRRLVCTMPDEVLDLLLRRLSDQEAQGYRAGYEAIPQFLDQVFEPIIGHACQPSLIRKVRDQALIGGQWRWLALPELYRAVSGNFGPESVVALREWLHADDPNRIVAVVRLLAGTAPTFVFTNQEFVAQLLDRAEHLGYECLRRVRSDLLVQAMTYARSGPAGQPYPQDIAQRDQAAALLEQLPRGTSMYSLIEAIRDQVESHIREEIQKEEELDG
jgi:hypothetical protein